MATELGLLIIVVVVFLAARIVFPGKAQNGIGLLGDATPYIEEELLRVSTFNIQTGKSLDGKRDINRSAQPLSEVDIAGVQEVYAASWLNKLGLGTSQALSLANTGNFQHLFAVTRYRWFREQRGNLLLSRLPVTNWRIEMLSDQSHKSPRNMTIAELHWKGEPFIFINTHLHTGKGREQQLQEVLAEFAKYPRAILVGDFNTRYDSPVLGAAIADPSIEDSIAVAQLDPQNRDRIDWVLTKGFRTIEGKFLDKGISDHPYYQVSLSLDN